MGIRHAESTCINDTALICLTESFVKEVVEEEKEAAAQDLSQHGLQLDYQSYGMSLRLI